MFLEIEAGLAFLGLVLAFAVPNLGSRWFEAIERTFGGLAKRRGLSVIVVGITALGLRAALLPILPVPQPGVQDEFGYLLMSDTFAHGRLTNLTNPMWAHFESFSIIWHPTYAGKYYPAQGLIMALGQVLTGHPFWGIWLSVGLMCAAITWMLQAYVGGGWALLGGFLTVIRFGTFNYWANSYYGGALGAFGGALVLGSLPRLKQERRVRNALLMGLGFAIIANTRPYEGLFFGIPVAVAILVWLWKMDRQELGQALKRAMVPLMAVLALTLAGMGYYNWRVTGSPVNTPFLVYMHTYDPIPYFPWQSMRPEPIYHDAVMRVHYLKQSYVLFLFKQEKSVAGIITCKIRWGALYFWTFFLGPVFTLPFLLAWGIVPYGISWRDISPGTRFLLLVGGITIAGEALPLPYFPQYSAPLTCVVIALVLAALRRIRPWRWRGRPSGLFFTRSVPSICILLLLLRVSASFTHWPPIPRWPKGFVSTWCSQSVQLKSRAAMLSRLRQYPGRQLVFVRYGPNHPGYADEWVYNRADLDSAKVVWARDLGPARNEKLIRYFKGRQDWLVYADDHPPKLEHDPETQKVLVIRTARAPLK